MRQTLIDENSRKEQLKNNLPPIQNGNASRHLQLKQHAEVIKNAVFKDKLRTNASSAVLEFNARDGRGGVGSVRKTISPLSLPESVEDQARVEANSYLSKSPSLDISNIGEVDSINLNLRQNSIPSDDSGEQFLDFFNQDVPGFTQLQNDLSEVEPGSEAEELLLNRQKELLNIRGNLLIGENNLEEDQDRLLNTFGIDPNSKAGAILKECIPCGRRKLSLDDIEFSDPFVNTIEDIKNKYNQLLNMLESLTLGDQLEDDLCDLLNLWNAQCLPDLFGMISLLGILQTKYLSGIELSWSSALNSLIAPFLTPVIGPLTHNLERYIDMIANPLVCMVESIEAQMYKLDVVGAVNQAKSRERALNRKKVEFYDSKISALTKRKDAILRELKNGNFNSEVATGNLLTQDLSQPAEGNIRFFPKSKISNPFSESEIDLNEDLKFLPGVNSQSYLEELKDIEIDIAKAKESKENFQIENKENLSIDGELFREAYKSTEEFLDERKKDIQEAKEYQRSILLKLSGGLNLGIQVVRDSLEVYRTELERTITGRIQTQQDQIELARNLQKIQRLVSMANAIIQLKKNGWSLSEICDRSNNSAALGAFVGAYKTQPNSSDLDFYKGTDSAGNELLVVATGGTNVNVTSIEFDELGPDDLIGDVRIEDVQTTATFNDLNEADSYNRRGILLDLGNIGESEISLSLNDAGSQKTSLDLRAENSYVIIKNDFCSKLPSRTGSASSVRQWAENL